MNTRISFIVLTLVILNSINITSISSMTDPNQVISQNQTSVGPFVIDGEVELSEFIVNNELNGNGSEVNPYVIENLSISGLANYPVIISNSDAHLILRNLELKSGLKGGLQIFKSSNVIVENNVVDNNFGDGIHLNGTRNIIIRDNIISNTLNSPPVLKADGRWNFPFAIDVERSTQVEIYQNTLYDNIDGIWFLDYVNNSVIHHNNVTNHIIDGIGAGGPSIFNIEVMHNFVSDVRWGIWMVGGRFVDVKENTVLDSEIGLLTEYTDNGNYSQNSFVNNEIGIEFRLSADESIITQNLIKHSDSYGLKIDSSIADIQYNAFIGNNANKKQGLADTGNILNLHSNFYDDLEPRDSNNDNIVDSQYIWDGSQNFVDPTPTVMPSEFIPQEYNNYESTWLISMNEETTFSTFSVIYIAIFSILVVRSFISNKLSKKILK